MAETPPQGLRDYLAQKAPDLATRLNALWLNSAPLHERQNRPDSNENGRQHVEKVERNIWRLLTETRDKDGKLNLDNLKPGEVFLLSAAACCHDFDKALKSGRHLPKSFKHEALVHGEGSAEIVKANLGVLGINEHQADDIAAAIGIHDLKAGVFEEKLAARSAGQFTPDGSINLHRVAVLLKAADILHCDYSRIRDSGIDLDKLAEGKPDKERKLARSKYLARGCTRGWDADGTRIRIQATPNSAEKLKAFGAAFQYMTNKEWKAIADELEHMGFPHCLGLHDDTAKVVMLPDDEVSAEPTPPPAGPRDFLQDYPEPQSKWVGRVGELAELHTAWLAGHVTGQVKTGHCRVGQNRPMMSLAVYLILPFPCKVPLFFCLAAFSSNDSSSR